MCVHLPLETQLWVQIIHPSYLCNCKALFYSAAELIPDVHMFTCQVSSLSAHDKFAERWLPT